MPGRSLQTRMRIVAQSVKIRPVTRRERFLFSLLCFLFFRRSQARSLETSPVGTLVTIPYIFFAEIYFFGSLRYFVVIGKRIAGLVSIQENGPALFISVLAVNPLYRGIGVASFILNSANIWARKMGKTSLELSVAKANRPAQRLYTDYGFHLRKEKKRSYILQYTL